MRSEEERERHETNTCAFGGGIGRVLLWLSLERLRKTDGVILIQRDINIKEENGRQSGESERRKKGDME